jgi:TolA-binding protein
LSLVRWVTAVIVALIPAKTQAQWRPFGFSPSHTTQSHEAAAASASLVRESDGTWKAVRDADNPDSPARRDFEAAEELFRNESYYRAARAFGRLAKRNKGTSIEEDSLFMEAESWYKLGWIPKAQDTYAQLLNKHPTTRHLPDAIQRTYDIAYHWLEDSRRRAMGEKGTHSAASRYVNLFDWSRPIFDTDGRAIQAIETIQQYDPFGPLADDAAMMAGAQKFMSGEYVQAAGYYERLATDQPKSKYAARALMLGAQAYLRAYQGPNYDGADLDHAHRLTKLALSRARELSAEDRQRLESDLRVIHLEQAKRDFASAEHYLKLRQPQSARYYFDLVRTKYPDTDWARRAEEESARLASLPAPRSNVFMRILQRDGTPPDPIKPADDVANDQPADKPARDVENSAGDGPRLQRLGVDFD